jgi:hypothetical protein
LVFNKDVCPDGDELLEGNGKPEVVPYGLKKFLGGYLPHIKRIDDSFLEIEEIREYFSRFLKLFFLRKATEFFCNLVVIERKDDIAEIEEDDLDGRRFHFFPLAPLGRGEG